MQTEHLRVIAAASAGLLIGAAGSYLVTRKLLAAKYEARANEEIENVKNTYRMLRKEGVYSTPRGAMEALRQQAGERTGEGSKSDVDRNRRREKEVVELKDLATALGYTGTPVDEMDDPDYQEPHIADSELSIGDEFTAEIEQIIDRGIFVEDTEVPEFLDAEEFYVNEDDYRVVHLEYYEDDDVLVNGITRTLVSAEETVSRDCLNGAPDDADIFYVRNNRRGTFYEVTREAGRFAEALGVSKDLLDTDVSTIPVKKMRDND